MQKTIDDSRFEYDSHRGLHAWCRLQVWELPRHPAVALVCEAADSPSTYLAEDTDRIATLVWQLLDCPTRGIIYIECELSSEGNEDANTFNQVTFSPMGDCLIYPERRALHRLEVEIMVGGATV